MKEEREERWRVENEGLAREGEDKGAMRDYYKVRSARLPPSNPYNFSLSLPHNLSLSLPLRRESNGKMIW